MLRRHPFLSLFLACVLGAGAYYLWLIRPVPDFGRTVLLYSQTEGSRHSSIAKGIDSIVALGRQAEFNVQASDDTAVLSDESLASFQAVIFLNTSGDALNEEQQVSLERYIQAGGGFVGIHAAAELSPTTDKSWPWYHRLLGGVFASYPQNADQLATVTVRSADHPASQALPPQWQIADEWADFRHLSEGVEVLLTVDESGYEGATMAAGEQHPMVWAREFDGGRSFYMGLGHSEATYDDANFLTLLQGGILYAMGDGKALDYSKSRPETWRFTRRVLDSNLNEPLKLAFSPTGDLYFVERNGNLRRYDFAQEKSILVHHFDEVRTFNEYGLLGLAFAPDFASSHWLYLYRTVAHADSGRQVLSRFKLRDHVLDVHSEQVLLTVPADGNDAQFTSHTGGDMLFDDVGRLWLSVGDDTKPGNASLIDDRPGNIGSDAARSAGNTQDLRGKILRIKPRATADENGRYYDIPQGNLFTSAEDGRAEIFVMGLRNPYTLAYDPRRQRIYWGEVGPDAREEDERGPKGVDEINFAEQAGNFGWPYVIGDNRPYHYYDYAQNKALDTADVNAPRNTSNNNTGLKILPPAQPAWISYTYDESEAFFELGAGGRNALVAPIYYAQENDAASDIAFPEYFSGKLLISDFIRRWLMVVNTDETGQPETIVPLFDQSFSAPLDMAFGPDGALYFVEYGTDWFSQNEDSYLSRIEYYSGDNPPPIAMANASQTIGAAPLQTKLDASASFDRGVNSGKLSYRWQLVSGGKPATVIGEQAIQAYTFDAPGEFFVQLTVTDEGGQQSSQRLRFQVGNERPDVVVKINGNRSFYWEDQPLDYQVTVVDKEDGSTADASIAATDVVVKFGYVAGGEDLVKALSQMSVDPLLEGKALVTGGSDCHACHGIDSASIGPSFMQIAVRYRPRADAVAYLQRVIADGGSGQWEGNHAMPGHADLAAEQLDYISSFILSLGTDEPAKAAAALAGVLRFTSHQDEYLHVQSSENLTLDLGRFYPGNYLFNASYTDKGTASAPPLQGQTSLILRHPRMTPSAFDELVNMRGYGIAGQKIAFVVKPWKEAPLSYGLLKGIDLTGVKRIKVSTWGQKPLMSGGVLELRLDSPENQPIASAQVATEFIPTATGLPVDLDVSAVEGIHDIYLGTSLAEEDKELAKVHTAVYGITTIEFMR